MRLLVVGCGFIGGSLAKSADGMDEVTEVRLMDSNEEKVEALSSSLAKSVAVHDLASGLKGCDLMIEAASQSAALSLLPVAIENGVDCMVMSVGAFVNDDFRDQVFQKAKENGVRIFIPSGAVCGTDGLRAASAAELDEVDLITTKGPGSLKGAPFLDSHPLDEASMEGPTVIFRGSARDAVKAFPKNVNVSATVSMLGIGFDRTRVTVVVDPHTETNSHELIVKGRFGEMRSITRNVHSPDNPATSYLAGLSAVSALRRIIRNEWIGV